MYLMEGFCKPSWQDKSRYCFVFRHRFESDIITPRNQEMERFFRCIIAIAVFGSAAIAIWLHQPPEVVPESATLTEFSAERAFKHVKAIAIEPHVAGTPANFRVRDYILEELRKMGGTPFTSKELVIRNEVAAKPENILVRIPGRENSKAFSLMAHYDSVYFGPGADDNGAGVAAMLEIFRALKSGEPLKNDIIFVFSDGEERGLMGAQAFLEHPWAKETGLMINFEARGTKGPSYLFETSRENGWLIPHIAQAAPFPMTSYLMFSVYIRLPVTTDYKVLKEAIPGMNVAFIDNLPYYHSFHDSPDELDLRSLQHHGSYGLAFARYFGNISLNSIPKISDEIYFNTIGTNLVHYPGFWNLPISVFVTFLFVWVFLWSEKQGVLSESGIKTGFGVVIKALIFNGAILGIAIGIAFLVQGPYLLYNENFFITGTLFLTLYSISQILSNNLKRISLPELSIGFLSVWLAGMWLANLFFPGGTFLFQYPLLFALLSWLFILVLGKIDPDSYFTQAVMTFSAIPGVILVSPMILGLFSAITVLMASAIMSLTVLLFGLASIPLSFLFREDSRKTRIISLLVGIVCFSAGLITGKFTPENPRMNSVIYVKDANAGKAYWIGNSHPVDEWTRNFFPENAVATVSDLSELFTKKPAYIGIAPDINFSPPAITMISESFSPKGTRKLCFKIESTRGATRMRVDFSAAEPPSNVFVSDKPLTGLEAKRTFFYAILREKEFDVSLEIASGPLEIRLTDTSYELPKIPGLPPRPPYMTRQSNTITLGGTFESDTTSVTKIFKF